MSRDAFKLRDSDKLSEECYLGYKAAVYDNLGQPGFSSSLYRMSLFGMTTVMFALGIIALVLNTMIVFQEANIDSSISCNTCYRVWETTTFLMVHLHDAFLSSA
jgi:hypothetical protein